MSSNGEIEQILPQDSRVIFSPDLPPFSSSLVDAMGVSRSALSFAARMVPLGNGECTIFGNESPGNKPRFTSCVTGANPLASLIRLPCLSLPSLPHRREVVGR